MRRKRREEEELSKRAETVLMKLFLEWRNVLPIFSPPLGRYLDIGTPMDSTRCVRLEFQSNKPQCDAYIARGAISSHTLDKASYRLHLGTN